MWCGFPLNVLCYVTSTRKRKQPQKAGDAMMRKFFRKHIRLAQFLCPHDSSNDIGTLTTYDGKQRIVSQCRYCGLIIVATKRFRELDDELTVPFMKEVNRDG